MFLKKCNKLGFKVGLVSGKMSDNGKLENIILYLGTETGIPFTRIVSYIHSEPNDSFLSSNHTPSPLSSEILIHTSASAKIFWQAQRVNQEPIISEIIP